MKIELSTKELILARCALVERARMLRQLPEDSNPNARAAALEYSALAEKLYNQKGE